MLSKLEFMNSFQIENDLTLLKKKIENEKGIFLRAQTTQKGLQTDADAIIDCAWSIEYSIVQLKTTNVGKILPTSISNCKHAVKQHLKCCILISQKIRERAPKKNLYQESQLKAACSDKFNEIDERIQEQKQIFSSLQYFSNELMIEFFR